MPMMKAVSEMTRPCGVPTTVSLNAIMVDGTGMCGGCRVTIEHAFGGRPAIYQGTIQRFFVQAIAGPITRP